ncbi:hypothetical protein ACVWYF_002556 [Hymenobacter sp. UYAg731]
MKNNLLHSLLALLLLLGLCGPARAVTPPPAPGRSLAEALNPNGTLKTGLNGSFDARAFRMGTAPDGRPVFRPAGVAGAGDERWADGFGLPNGVDRPVSVVVQAGANTYVGGDFSIAGDVAAIRVAKWNGTAWSSLGTGSANGVNGTVKTMAVTSTGEVYVGGVFTQAGGLLANRVAKWNGTAWSSLGTGSANGVNFTVNALAVASSGDVYVGGEFTQAGGVPAGRVAKWNGTAWSSLDTGSANGVNGTVKTLAVAGNGEVYVGGYFNLAGGAIANCVAKWNGTAWSSLSTGTANGVNGYVNALAVASTGEVYAGGEFNQAGGVRANFVAKWDGTAWSSLGTGNANGMNGPVFVLAVASSGEVYLSGGFNSAGATYANSIAKWNGTSWSGVGNGLAGAANGLAVASTGEVYAGGVFTQAGGMPASCVAKWNGTAWSSLGTGTANGVSGVVSAVAVASTGEVYVGGSFIRVGGVPANYVAKWNGTAWSSLGTGTANGVSGPVSAVAVASTGEVYVGGDFTQAGGVLATRVAKWNGANWSSLGTGFDLVSTINAVAVASTGEVYVGGDFAQAGGVPASRVAKWNGTAWSSLGTGSANGVNGTVKALAVAGSGEVYAGGVFTQAGGVPANFVAKWNGTAWSSLGTGVDVAVNARSVNAVAVASTGEVYVGGDFTRAGGVSANYVAKWDGTAWSSLGTGNTNGAPYAVMSLAVASTGEVYAGTSLYYGSGGRVELYSLAKWNGTAWSSLGTGLNKMAFSIACGPTGQVYVGGDFATTGDGSKVTFHFGIYDPNAMLATTAARAAPAAQLFPNPAHGTATLRLPAGAPRQPLTLTDALGRTVRRYPAPAAGSDAELDLRGLPAGVYVVRCGSISQRLVVE